MSCLDPECFRQSWKTRLKSPKPTTWPWWGERYNYPVDNADPSHRPTFALTLIVSLTTSSAASHIVLPVLHQCIIWEQPCLSVTMVALSSALFYLSFHWLHQLGWRPERAVEQKQEWRHLHCWGCALLGTRAWRSVWLGARAYSYLFGGATSQRTWRSGHIRRSWRTCRSRRAHLIGLTYLTVLTCAFGSLNV